MFSGIEGFGEGINQAYARYSQNTIRQAPAGSGLFTRRNRPGGTSEQQGSWFSPPENIGDSEIDKYASAIIRYHYPDRTNFGDASKLVPDRIPDFDLLCAGFPCQAFSIAGKRQGFNEARGTLFFEIARVLSHKRPAHFLLENVEGLRSHEEGKTLQEILRVLAELDYFVEVVLLNSKHYGVPQNRERLFFIGHSGEQCQREILSFGQALEVANGDGREGVGLFSGTIDSNYFKGPDGKRTMIQLNEARQGERIYDGDGIAATVTAPATGGTKNNFYAVGTLRTHKDDDWTKYGRFGDKVKEISDTQRYKCCGNAVSTVAVEAIILAMIAKGCLST